MLYFLRAVAPTKLVDGAWLYGLLPHWRNARFADLVRTYVEELGEGAADENQVLIYRKLLSRHGLDPLDDLAPARPCSTRLRAVKGPATSGVGLATALG